MRAVRFRVTAPGYLLAKSLGSFDAFVTGKASGLRLVDHPRPSLPGPDWLRLEVLYCGICGSDLGNISFASSPAMEPFGSFPAVLGHEIVGRIKEAGPRARFALGARVVVDPMLHCEARGHLPRAWCASCREGLHGTCEKAADEGAPRNGAQPLAPGLTIGYHRDLPGGWGEEVVAHQRQLFKVPEEVPDKVAALTEPLAIGVRGVLRSGAISSTGPVLVVGSGMIAFATIWALRVLGYEGELMAQAKRSHEQRLALKLGADCAFAPGAEARAAMIGTGASAYQPMIGPEVFAGGGFRHVIDCVGTESSLDQSFRFIAPRGRITLLGCAKKVSKLDLTFLWAKEVDVRGSVGYGREEWRGEKLHSFELALRKMSEDPAPLSELVTHVFPLEEYVDALRAARNHGRSGAVKVLLQPGNESAKA